MKSILAVLLVSGILLFGCAGWQNQQAGGQQGGAQPSGGAPQAGGAGAGGNAGTSGSSGAGTGSSGQPAENALDSLLGLLKLNSGWKVTYQLSGTGMQGTSEMSQYVKGLDKLRTDVSAAGTQTRTYLLGTNIYFCTNSGEWSCMKFSIPQNDSSQLAADLEKNLEANPSKYTVLPDGTMQIAGVSATCFKVASEDGNVRYCVSNEGVPLYTKTTAESGGKTVEFEMKATSYSTSVTDSDFSLPAEPTEFTLPSGLDGGNGSGFDACSVCDYFSGSEKADCLASC